MKKSTKSMLRKHGWRVDRFLHNYLYFLFYYPYVKTIQLSLRLVRHLTWFKPLAWAARFVFNRYHSKVLSTDDTRKILTLDQDVIATSDRNRQIIPYRYAYKILLQEADFIAVMDCPCKKSLGAPPELINSCLAVGKGLATFWLEHCEKYNARQITQQEALDLIRSLRDKDHITQAFFKVATGGSTGVICNCHPETCVSLIATQIVTRMDPDVSMTAASGYSVERDEARCTLCGRCAEVCPFSVIHPLDMGWEYDRQACLGCERCVECCPSEALTLYRDPDKPLPLDLDAIRAELAADPAPSDPSRRDAA